MAPPPLNNILFDRYFQFCPTVRFNLFNRYILIKFFDLLSPLGESSLNLLCFLRLLSLLGLNLHKSEVHLLKVALCVEVHFPNLLVEVCFVETALLQQTECLLGFLTFCFLGFLSEQFHHPELGLCFYLADR